MYCCATADILTKLLQHCFLFFIVVVIPGHNLGNSQVSVNRTIGPTLVINGPQLLCSKTWFYRGTYYLSWVLRKPTFWFSTWSDTNQAVQSQKMARGLKFRIWKEEGLYYLCSENKGADQLRGHREADLRPCFCICKMLVFL